MSEQKNDLTDTEFLACAGVRSGAFTFSLLICLAKTSCEAALQTRKQELAQDHRGARMEYDLS